MTPEDRDLLLSLRHQQADLRHTLERLTAQLDALEARAGLAAPEASENFPPLPPLPIEAALPPIPPPMAAPVPEVPLPPIPLAPAPPTPKPSFEFQFGRWLTRIGALFGVIALALIFALPKVQALLGHAGLLALSAAAGLGVVILGERLERKGAASRFFGCTIAAMALAWLYLTACAACYYEPLRVIHSPLAASLVLLLWPIYVLLLAERKNSQAFAFFAVLFAYVGTAVNPVGHFMMGADLILALTSAVFLLRRGWAAVSYVSLAGTYYALFHRLVVDESGEFVFDTSRALHFAPYAAYLVIAWLIFTTATILATAPGFRGGKRLAFLSLNNGALAGLLALAAYIAGYDAGACGWTLLDAGLVFLVTSRFAGFAEIDPVDVMGAYAAQGLALVTAGIIVVYTGITRGVLLLIETFFLGVAGAFSGDRILTVSTYVSSFFATLFLIWEIAVNAHHPWLLGFGGAAVMLINAWSSRGEVRHSPKARSTVVVSTSCYCVMAAGLIYAALCTDLNASTLPPALALAAVALTFSIYYVSLFELPPIAQTLLIAAQALVLFPAETGEELPWWSTFWVAAVTLLLVTWWSRQRVTRSGSWTVALTFLYALALAGLAHQTVRPYLDAQGWIVGASLLSIAFLVYGAFARVWAVAAIGQIFLALALHHFFFPPDRNVFPWAWWAAALPVVVLFSTARAAHEWLRLFTEIPDSRRKPLRLLAYGYQLLALAGLVRWVFAIVPDWDQVAVFLFLGTLVLSTSVRQSSAFGVRCSFVLSILGMWLYLDNLQAHAHAMAHWLNALAMLLFLAQTALLRHEGKSLATTLESWALIIFSVATSWIFVSAWVWTRLSPGYLTLGWALFALFLFLFGLFVRERRLRWCGMAVILAAILRVGCCDMWSFSLGYRVLTFIALALITLAIGYILLRRADPRQPAK
ncbi:MAG TPA: DUF2339 domain-containing protein [Candidatus Methylacidiphilales bacterium]|jgi:hypothetical protein|nr:DUF2339 domain-containing protein [Candidatus Methylacidiphilales bacterium]